MEITLLESKLSEAKSLGYVPFFDDKFKIKSYRINGDIVEIVFINKKEKEIFLTYNPLTAADLLKEFYFASLPPDMQSERKTKKTDIVPSKSLYNIQTVRNHLFEALEGLESGKISDSQAKATASVAQTILNSAKLEMEYKKMCGNAGEVIDLLES